MSRREQIMARVATVLAATAGVSGRVYRSRTEPARKEELPVIMLDWTGDDALTVTNDFMDWTLQLRVVLVVRGDEPDSAADSIVSSIYNLLMADRTLNGLAIDLEPVRVSNELQDGDMPHAILTSFFNIRYRIPAASM